MGANADPSGSLGGHHRHLSSPVPAPAPAPLPQHQHGVAAGTVAALRHDPGLAARWSPEEQILLDKGLAKFAADAPVVRYAKIAMSLPEKTVRDVALRCRWMAKKESSKKRKEELSKKSKEKKERVGDSSSKGPAHLVARPNANAPSYTVPVLPIDDDDVSYKGIKYLLCLYQNIYLSSDEISPEHLSSQSVSIGSNWRPNWTDFRAQCADLKSNPFKYYKHAGTR
ncbi:unnamed protein product [Urochloa decumbens]|uniref:Myb-like domain-containing protein n=1 Tax=Urochloa decumbens TaxID=240449 RepID=A0ABC8WDA9_9POAL